MAGERSPRGERNAGDQRNETQQTGKSELGGGLERQRVSVAAAEDPLLLDVTFGVVGVRELGASARLGGARRHCL